MTQMIVMGQRQQRADEALGGEETIGGLLVGIGQPGLKSLDNVVRHFLTLIFEVGLG